MLQYIWNLKTFSTWSKADTKGQWLSYHIVWGSQRSLIQRDRKVGFYVQFNKETGLVNLCWGRLYRDQSSCSEQLGEKAMVYILYTQSTHELEEDISPWALCEVGKTLPFLHGSEILRSLKWPQKKMVSTTHIFLGPHSLGASSTSPDSKETLPHLCCLCQTFCHNDKTKLNHTENWPQRSGLSLCLNLTVLFLSLWFSGGLERLRRWGAESL